jgi:hypothetical protein
MDLVRRATRDTAWITWFATRPRVPYWLLAAVWATIPLLQLVLYRALVSVVGVAPGPVDPQLPNRIANTYLILLSFAFLRIGARESTPVARLSGEPIESRTVGVTRGLLVPLIVAAILSTTYLVGLIASIGAERIAAAPLVFFGTYLAGLAISLPESAAFWFAVVGLLLVERVARGSLPRTFPEDRSLGLRPVGRFWLFIFITYTAGSVPVLVTSGAGNLPNFLAAVAIVMLGFAVMAFAVWRLHTTMADERERRVTAARETYATAYRAAERALAVDATSGGRGGGTPALAPASTALLAADALVRGAESIHEWPFNEGVQRIVAVILTGVMTAIVVRLVFFAVGL